MNTEVKRPVIILGAGGHAKVVADVLTLCGYNIIGLITPDEVVDSICFGFKVLGNDEAIHAYASNEIILANGIGSLPGEKLRWNLTVKFQDKGYEFIRVIHPSAIIAKDVELAEGVQVMAGVVIQSGTRVGYSSIINTGTNVDHDCCVSKNCHLSPSVTLSGGVNVSEGTHLGTGTTVIQNVSIGSNCIVAAGSVIYRNISNGVTLIQSKNNVIQQEGEV